MCGVALKLIFPTERRVPTDDLIILSETESKSVLIGIADLVEFLNAEVVVTGSEDEL